MTKSIPDKYQIIECFPSKNIVYTMSATEFEMMNNMLDGWMSIYGKYPRVTEMIQYISKSVHALGLFNDIKIEEKETKDLKGMAGSFIFLDDPV